MTLDAKTVIANLQAEIEAERDENAAAVALIQDLVQEIKSAATQGDLQAVQALTDQAHTNAQALADAIKANSGTGFTPSGNVPAGG